jgi:predicted kinase
MPTVELMVGMIASGKSTYARKRGDDGALIVCFDDLTAMLHARYRYDPELRATYRLMEEALAYAALTKAGRDVLIDRTHLTRESRARWVILAREWGVPIVAVATPIMPAEVHAIRRFRADPRGRSLEDWSWVALHHAGQARAEPLESSEGFAEIRTFDLGEG